MVLERESQEYHLPRAVHFDDESMRVFQTIGIAKALSKLIRVNPFNQPAVELIKKNTKKILLKLNKKNNF